MAQLQIELDLLNRICHSCDCIINGEKKTNITKEDVENAESFIIEDKVKPLPLDYSAVSQESNQRYKE